MSAPYPVTHPAAEVLRSGLDSKKSMRGVLLVKLRARVTERWAGQHQYLNWTPGLSQGYCTLLYISMTFCLGSVLGRRGKQTQRHRLLYGKGELEPFSLYKRRHELDTEEVRLLDMRKLKSGKNQSRQVMDLHAAGGNAGTACQEGLPGGRWTDEAIGLLLTHFELSWWSLGMLWVGMGVQGW